MVGEGKATGYAWYCGRFLGCCEMLRKPDVYTRELVIEQLLQVQDEYEHEKQQVEQSQVQTSGPQCKRCHAFTAYRRIANQGLCMKCEGEVQAQLEAGEQDDK